MRYQLEKHGDRLERHAAAWVARTFPNYERVWSRYIGHKGDGTMADMPEYKEKAKRILFSERSYTVLQSAMVMNKILVSGIFEKSHDDIDIALEFHKSILSFYAALGRINDCVVKAAEIIGLRDIKDRLTDFYNQRNILLHGCTLPLLIDDMGFVRVPDLNRWDDKSNTWSNMGTNNTSFVVDTATDTFRDLMMLINDIYGAFYDVICGELKALGVKLEVERDEFKLSYFDLATSGSTHIT